MLNKNKLSNYLNKRLKERDIRKPGWRQMLVNMVKDCFSFRLEDWKIPDTASSTFWNTSYSLLDISYKSFVQITIYF